MPPQGEEDVSIVVQPAVNERISWMLDKIAISFRATERDLTNFSNSEEFQYVQRRFIIFHNNHHN